MSARCPMHGSKHQPTGCGVCLFIVIDSDWYKNWMEGRRVGSEQS